MKLNWCGWRVLMVLGAAIAGLAAHGQAVAGRGYVDHTRVLYCLDDMGHERPVKTAADWNHRRRDILAGMEEAMGKLPDRSRLPPLDVKVIQTARRERFTRYTLSFVAEKGEMEERIPAYLFIPTQTGKKRVPAILALHQTALLGKGDATIAGPEDQGYGAELAALGYVVLCPDYPSFGDYKFDFKAAFSSGRYASGTMKGIFNHMRCVDLLQSREEVDPGRIGVIGHSLGGHNAMFVAAFDQRIGAIASSCGWTPFEDYYGGKIAGWTSDRYMPRLNEVYKLNASAVPFDFQEVVAALAPRPFFSNSPLHDANFDVEGVRKGIKEAEQVYQLLGAPRALEVRYPDCAHAFPPEIRLQAYEFLGNALQAGKN
jgi:dienelactone hydrolase